MRIDKLTSEAFGNAIKEYIDLRTGWGESEEIKKELEDGTFLNEMKAFDCFVYEDGTISAPDGQYTFREIAEGVDYQSPTAYMEALTSVFDYLNKVGVVPDGREDLERILEEDGIMFDEYGNIGWIN